MDADFRPRISFVATSRNDDHGGDMLRRMQLFIRGLSQQCERFRLPCELVLVEWNPPSDRPFLIEVLPASGNRDFFRIRYVRVPQSIHQGYRFSDSIPLFQMIAKNAGIRRAQAEWICATNVDLLFSDELFSFLASRSLDAHTFYRANRIDYPASVPAGTGIEAWMQHAWKFQINRYGKNRRFPNIASTRFLRYVGFPGMEWLVSGFATLKRWVSSPLKTAMLEMDTDACGDFTLMHRDAWQAIRGYAEIDLYSIHIDSLALYSARAAGCRQCILHPRAVTFHMEHHTGWASPDPVDRLRLNIRRPGLDWSTVKDLGAWLLKNKKPLEWNTDNWGLASEKLEVVEG